MSEKKAALVITEAEAEFLGLAISELGSTWPIGSEAVSRLEGKVYALFNGDTSGRYIVTDDRPYYPSVHYFDDLEAAQKEYEDTEWDSDMYLHNVSLAVEIATREVPPD